MIIRYYILETGKYEKCPREFNSLLADSFIYKETCISSETKIYDDLHIDVQ